MNKHIIPWLKNLLKSIKLPELIGWLKTSGEEESGKTSGKRLSAAFFSFLIAYVVVYGVHQKDLTTTLSDFIIWIVIALLGYVATVFGLSYIPTRNQKKDDTTTDK